ncbi:Sec-independent protein translocase subunit TatA/TatB [Mucilaginibacter panaciglaebae]|uniref:Sec-independent protein translocase protein TatA n=1 Tax=Mucilaginibacter panaciglaebae TaxID=502331 RepID=A0ABP7WWK8_9SPHI
MFSSVLLFFEFTPPEIMLILFVVLLLFGGDKLPGLARGLGKGIRDFKDASEGVKREINNQIDNYDKKKEETKAAEETPKIAEHSTDNPAGTKEETPAVTTAPAATPVANTVPVSQTHSATDNVLFDGTPESDPELYKHYRGEGAIEESATTTAIDSEKKQTNN